MVFIDTQKISAKLKHTVDVAREAYAVNRVEIAPGSVI